MGLLSVWLLYSLKGSKDSTCFGFFTGWSLFLLLIWRVIVAAAGGFGRSWNLLRGSGFYCCLYCCLLRTNQTHSKSTYVRPLSRCIRNLYGVTADTAGRLDGYNTYWTNSCLRKLHNEWRSSYLCWSLIFRVTWAFLTAAALLFFLSWGFRSGLGFRGHSRRLGSWEAQNKTNHRAVSMSENYNLGIYLMVHLL